MKKIMLLAALMLTSFVATAGDPVAGKKKSGTCAACHGVEGVTMIPAYPNLAGQKEDYIVLSLKAFRSGERKRGNAAIMASMAVSLSDQDIADLAAYYASL